jgi:zinc/manganese transport system substrate-binding protein
MGTILTNGYRRAGALLGVVALAATACGDDGSGGTAAGGGDGEPHIVATTTILGDVTQEVMGDAAEVQTLMPAGADPHQFSLSAREVQEVMEADVLVANGLDFEEGILDVIEQAESSGVEVVRFADHVSVIETDDEEGEHTDDEHADDEHAEEEDGHAEEEDDHDHGSEDPHIWTDPTRMAGSVDALADVVADLDGVDTQGIHDRADSYVEELTALDEEINGLLADVPDDRRVLVTNHEVFGYFADRYDFEVVGTVIPSTSTMAESSSSELEDLAELIEDYDLPAIFAEVTEGSGRAETVAGEVGDVEVVELYSESLGEEGSGAESYVGMMRTNASLIADALG